MANTPPQNPPIVLEGLTRPDPLSLARLALLEKIGSPFVEAPRPATFAEVLPSLYLQSLSLEEAIAQAYDPNLTAHALLWANALSCEDYQAQVSELNAALEAFFGALPRPESEDTPKKA